MKQKLRKIVVTFETAKELALYVGSSIETVFAYTRKGELVFKEDVTYPAYTAEEIGRLFLRKGYRFPEFVNGYWYNPITFKIYDGINEAEIRAKVYIDNERLQNLIL
jgi:hypothetical protein